MITTPVRQKIQSRAALAELKARFRDAVLMRIVSDEPEHRREVNVCVGDRGLTNGARDILKRFYDEINAAGLKDPSLEDVSVIAIDSMDNVAAEPIVQIVEPGKAPVYYKNVTPALVTEIIQSHLINRTPVASAMLEV